MSGPSQRSVDADFQARMQKAAAGLGIHTFCKLVQQVFKRHARKRETAGATRRLYLLKIEHHMKIPLRTCVIFKAIARDSTLAQLDTAQLCSIQNGLVILTSAITGGLYSPADIEHTQASLLVMIACHKIIPAG